MIPVKNRDMEVNYSVKHLYTINEVDLTKTSMLVTRTCIT